MAVWTIEIDSKTAQTCPDIYHKRTQCNDSQVAEETGRLTSLLIYRLNLHLHTGKRCLHVLSVDCPSVLVLVRACV